VEAESWWLFGMIEDLMKWENSTNEALPERAEIRTSCDGKLPPVYDPFSDGTRRRCGGLGLPGPGGHSEPGSLELKGDAVGGS